jgi:ribonuclease HII
MHKFDRRLIPDAPDFSFELELWEHGIEAVAGLDEAGRGSLAGPVVAAAVIFPPNPELARDLVGVRDSKEMTARQRSGWAVRLLDLCVSCAVGQASAQEIDDIGISPATHLAMQRALNQLAILPQYLLIDYVRLPECAIPQTALVKGDARALSIAAASILAKANRDETMVHLDSEYPGYGFAVHKGYGTQGHRTVMNLLGLTPVHRKSFRFHS